MGNKQGREEHSDTKGMLQHTIMVRDSNGGPNPIRAPVKPKSPEHAPAENAMLAPFKNQRSKLRNI